MSLHQENLEKFRVSCFGAFLDLGFTPCKGQLIAKMIESLTPESLEQGCFSFILNDKEYQLRPLDWYIITGLKFNGWYRPPAASAFHKDVFNDEDRLFVVDIEKRFDEVVAETGGKGDLCLKLALLLVLFGVLLVRDRVAKKIELQYMHLVDNLDRFNSYPWGLISYDFLLNFSHNARDRIVTSKISGAPSSSDAHGFTYMLQVFAYEVHSGIAAKCARKRGDLIHKFPRMLHWDALPGRVNYNDILKLLVAADCQTMPINPTVSERLELEREGISPDFVCRLPDGGMRDNMQQLPSDYSLRKRKLVNYEETNEMDYIFAAPKKVKQSLDDVEGVAKKGKKQHAREGHGPGGSQSQVSGGPDVAVRNKANKRIPKVAATTDSMIGERCVPSLDKVKKCRAKQQIAKPKGLPRSITTKKGVYNFRADTNFKTGDQTRPPTDGGGVRCSDEIRTPVVDAHVENTRNVEDERHHVFDDIEFSAGNRGFVPDVDVGIRGEPELRRQSTNVDGKKSAEVPVNSDHHRGHNETSIDLSGLPSSQQMEELITTMRESLQYLKTIDSKLGAMERRSTATRHNKYPSGNGTDMSDPSIELQYVHRAPCNQQNTKTVRFESAAGFMDDEESECPITLAIVPFHHRSPLFEPVASGFDEDIAVSFDYIDSEHQPQVPSKEPDVELIGASEFMESSHSRPASRRKVNTASILSKCRMTRLAAQRAARETMEINATYSLTKRIPNPLKYGCTDVEFPLMMPSIEWMHKFEEWFFANKDNERYICCQFVAVVQ